MYLPDFWTQTTTRDNYLRVLQKEDKENVYIDADVPGIPKEDISLNYSSDKRSITIAVKDKVYQDIYLSRGIDTENIEATLELGILRIRAPIKNNDKVIQII